MQQSARGTAYWRWGPFLNVSSSCTCSDSPQRRQAGLSAPLSSPVLAVVFTAVPGRGFLMPMQCDACRRAEPRSEKTCDDRVSPIGFRPAGSSLDLADSGRSPLCDSTLAGNTDSTRIRARIIRAKITYNSNNLTAFRLFLAWALPLSINNANTPFTSHS